MQFSLQLSFSLVSVHLKHCKNYTDYKLKRKKRRSKIQYKGFIVFFFFFFSVCFKSHHKFLLFLFFFLNKSEMNYQKRIYSFFFLYCSVGVNFCIHLLQKKTKKKHVSLKSKKNRLFLNLCLLKWPLLKFICIYCSCLLFFLFFFFFSETCLFFLPLFYLLHFFASSTSSSILLLQINTWKISSTMNIKFFRILFAYFITYFFLMQKYIILFSNKLKPSYFPFSSSMPFVQQFFIYEYFYVPMILYSYRRLCN